MTLERKSKSDLTIKKYIEFFLTHLPPVDLLSKTKTKDQKVYWAYLHQEFLFISQCWKAKINGESLPLESLVEQRKLDRFHADYYQITTDFYWALFELVQAVEPHIKDVYKRKNKPYPFYHAGELFGQILLSIAKPKLEKCLLPYHEHSYHKQDELIKLNRKNREQTPSALDTRKREALFKQVHPSSEETWAWLDWVIELSAGSKKRLVKARWENLELARKRAEDIWLAGAKKRETETFKKSHSFAWLGGQKIKVSRNGGHYSA